MAVKPPIIPWDSTLANIVAVTGTHQTNGIALGGEIPISGEDNAWKNNTYLWFLYLLNNIATITRTRLPFSLTNTANWTVVNGGGLMSCIALQNAVNAVGNIDLDIPQGYKLSTLTLLVRGSSAVPGLTMKVIKEPSTDIANTTLGTLTIAPGSMPTVAANQTMNMLLTSSGLTVTVAVPGSATYTRSAGSYLTDGFFVGQIVAWTGFVNGGNNQTVTITALSALVLTCAAGTAVVETGPAAGETVTGVSPTADGTFSLGLELASSAHSATTLAVAALRYTCVPQ